MLPVNVVFEAGSVWVKRKLPAECVEDFMVEMCCQRRPESFSTADGLTVFMSLIQLIH